EARGQHEPFGDPARKQVSGVRKTCSFDALLSFGDRHFRLAERRNGYPVESRVDIDELASRVRPRARGGGGIDERAYAHPALFGHAEQQAELLAAVITRHHEQDGIRFALESFPEAVQLRERELRRTARTVDARRSGIEAEVGPIATADLPRLQPGLRVGG